MKQYHKCHKLLIDIKEKAQICVDLHVTSYEQLLPYVRRDQQVLLHNVEDSYWLEGMLF